MNQKAMSAAMTLDDGRGYRIELELMGKGVRLTINGDDPADNVEPIHCEDDNALLATVKATLRPADGDEAEDVHNLVCHMLTCLDYFSSPSRDR